MKIQNLTKTINQNLILDQLSVDFQTGEITGILGRNGAGKTTLFRVIANHYQENAGHIFINQQKLQQYPNLYQKIFYIDEQYNFLSAYSLKKIVAFYQAIYPNFDKDYYERLITKHSLLSIFKFKAMSKGMQGLYKIILGICSNAEYLFFDEPFDGLDILVKKDVIDLMLDSVTTKKQGIIVSSHNLHELETIIDRVLILKHQKIVCDYHLETLREHAKKVQIVFKTKKIPTIIKENSQVLHFQRRVITVLFEHLTEELKSQISQEQPLLFEELPLTLHDLFEAKLISEKTEYYTKGM